MSQNQLQDEPKLAKPGAGLPFIEWATAKYIILPRVFAKTDKQKALVLFTRESKKIVKLATKLSQEELSTKRLVPRLRGLEDSSRYWSVAMTLEHLIIVSDLMRQAVILLSSGTKPQETIGTADVKPEKTVDPEKIIEKFEKMSAQFLQETTAANVDAFPKLTHPHPWFGPLNALQWLIFAPLHENIHHKQIEEIIARL
jgi:hypothetical protein